MYVYSNVLLLLRFSFIVLCCLPPDMLASFVKRVDDGHTAVVKLSTVNETKSVHAIQTGEKPALCAHSVDACA